MFGMTAKQRLAQMQQKGGTAAEPGKGVGGPKPVPGKVTAGPGLLKKPEPPKAPAVDPKKPVAPQPAKPQEPAKPKEEPKQAAAPGPAKPAAAPEPAKPKEEPAKPATAPEPAKPAAAQEPAKPAAASEAVKPAAAPEPAKPAAAPEPAKPAAAPEPAKPAAAPEPAKPKEEPAKPADAPEQAKPAAAPEPTKPAVAPGPAKPAAAPEPAKPAAAPEPAKPAAAPEPAKPAAAPEPAKPAAAPGPAKPAAAPGPAKPAAAPEPAKPAAAPEPTKPATASEPAKPKEEPKKPEPAKAVEPSKEPGKPVTKPSDDFFRGIFYFSGMGTLVGSALAEGVYVPDKAQRNAVDGDEIEAAYERQRLRRGEEIIATARSQAQGLSTDFRHLQALLESLPTFTEVLEPQPLDRRAVDQVIHGHVYFQQEQHPAPFQTRAAHHGGDHPPPHPPAAAATTEVQPSHQASIAKHPAGGVAVLPVAFDQKHSAAGATEGPGSFAAAIDEFDRVGATAQQPVYGARPPEARDSTRPTHRRERPTGDTAAASAADADKAAAGGARPHGAHTRGHQAAASPTSPSAWQDRYGQAEVAKFQAPRPFSAGTTEIDSKGVKSWQLSHLRTLEAKGYQIVAESEGDVVKSYAPYLVSDRSQGVDRQRALHPNFEPIAPRSPAFRSPSAPAPAPAQPSTFAPSPNDLPYCDL